MLKEITKFRWIRKLHTRSTYHNAVDEENGAIVYLNDRFISS